MTFAMAVGGCYNIESPAHPPGPIIRYFHLILVLQHDELALCLANGALQCAVGPKAPRTTVRCLHGLLNVLRSLVATKSRLPAVCSCQLVLEAVESCLQVIFTSSLPHKLEHSCVTGASLNKMATSRKLPLKRRASFN
jgi:hypothetical protein